MGMASASHLLELHVLVRPASKFGVSSVGPYALPVVSRPLACHQAAAYMCTLQSCFVLIQTLGVIAPEHHSWRGSLVRHCNAFSIALR